MLQQAPTSHQLESFLQMQLHSLMLATSRGWQRPTVGSHQSDCCLSNGLKVRHKRALLRGADDRHLALRETPWWAFLRPLQLDVASLPCDRY
ncbi:unnamed protein product [Musa banksii]